MEQVAQASQNLKEEVRAAVEKKTRTYNRTGKYAKGGVATRSPQSSNARVSPSNGAPAAIVAPSLAPPIPIEHIKPNITAAADWVAQWRKCEAYKMPDPMAQDLAQQVQIICQHLNATVNPLYAACFTAIAIVGIHGFTAYQIEIKQKEELARQNAVSAG